MTVLTQAWNAFVALLKWWVTVQPWERGLRVRMGRFVRVLKPGLHWKFPVIDIVHVQPVRPRSQYLSEQTLTAADGVTVTVCSSVQYEVADIAVLYQTLHNAHDTLEQETAAAIANYVSASDASTFSIDAAIAHVTGALRWERYGIRLLRFSISDFARARSHRLITGNVGRYTSYDQRLEVGEGARQS